MRLMSQESFVKCFLRGRQHHPYQREAKDKDGKASVRFSCKAGDGSVEWDGQKPECGGLGSEWEVGSRKTNMSNHEEVQDR